MLVARTKTKKQRKGKPSKERKKKQGEKKGIIIPTVIQALDRKDVLNSPLNK